MTQGEYCDYCKVKCYVSYIEIAEKFLCRKCLEDLIYSSAKGIKEIRDSYKRKEEK